jgi:hypothetical protein
MTQGGPFSGAVVSKQCVFHEQDQGAPPLKLDNGGHFLVFAEKLHRRTEFSKFCIFIIISYKCYPSNQVHAVAHFLLVILFILWMMGKKVKRLQCSSKSTIKFRYLTYWKSLGPTIAQVFLHVANAPLQSWVSFLISARKVICNSNLEVCSLFYTFSLEVW